MTRPATIALVDLRPLNVPLLPGAEDTLEDHVARTRLAVGSKHEARIIGTKGGGEHGPQGCPLLLAEVVH